MGQIVGQNCIGSERGSQQQQNSKQQEDVENSPFFCSLPSKCEHVCEVLKSSGGCCNRRSLNNNASNYKSMGYREGP